jgi:hypothetical protein
MHRLCRLLLFVPGVAFALSSSPSSTQIRRTPLGRITALDRSKLEEGNDSDFYRQPNLVTHTDDAFIQRLTDLYEKLLDDDAIILDLMSSHVSHLPPNKPLIRVDVHGMNAQELEENRARQRTDGSSLVRDLNENPSLIGLCDGPYDVVLCSVGIQYLKEPEAVFAEVARILRPGGLVIVSFTNRFFYQKALQGWINRGMNERSLLVKDYLRAAGGFEDIDIVGDGTSVWTQLASAGGLGGDPFVAVVGRRLSDP